MVQSMRPKARGVWAVALVALLDVWLLAPCSWAGMKPEPQSLGSATAPRTPQLTLDVKEPLGLSRTHWPVTAGVPFPQGRVREVSSLHSTDGSAAMPVQARVLSRWPDGSARWALLDWQMDLSPSQERRVRVESGSPSPLSAARDVVAIKLRDAGDHFEIDTGPLQFAIPKTRFAIVENVRLNGAPVTSGPIVSFISRDGTPIAAPASVTPASVTPASVTPAAAPPTEVKVIDAGPLRVRIELRGHYAAGFDYVVRVDAFARQPFIRVFHSFEQHAPEPYTVVRQIGIDLPLALTGTIAYSAGGEGGVPLSGGVPRDGVSLVQEDNEAFRVGNTRRPGHAAGWVDLHDATHGVAVIGRYFWQEYPQGFQLRRTGLTYNLWAPEARPAKVGMGAAKTHEMVLLFHDKQVPTAALLAAIGQPLLARIDPQWIVSTGALRNSLSPSPATTGFLRELGAAYRRYQANADAERWDDSERVRCADVGVQAAGLERSRRGFYGMFNWGDWNFPGYHDTVKGCDAWGNLEYDMTQVLALAYAATGERPYYDGMVAAARHFTDVDHIYYSRDRPSFVGMNHPKNPLHFTFELGGVDLGHTWTEGLLSYYSLTGDTRSLDAARGIADFLVHRLGAGLSKGNPRQFGWPQIALVATYEATGDERYKRAAIEYARRGMAAHPADRPGTDRGGAWKMGILAEAIAYTHSMSGDVALREWLLRYAAAVYARGVPIDPRYFPAVAYVGRMAGRAEYTRAASAAVERLKFGNWAKPFTIAGRLGFSLLSTLTESP
jgi:hypothetical protein